MGRDLLKQYMRPHPGFADLKDPPHMKEVPCEEFYWYHIKVLPRRTLIEATEYMTSVFINAATTIDESTPESYDAANSALFVLYGLRIAMHMDHADEPLTTEVATDIFMSLRNDVAEPAQYV